MDVPGVKERVEVCKQHLLKSVQWRGPVNGVYAVRGNYLNYLKGIPGIREYRNRLVTLREPEAIDAVLDEILLRYEGYELERTPIQLTNYHENCKL